MIDAARVRFGEAALAWRRAGLATWCRKIGLGDLEIETIHQARVGTRRFRAALGLFSDLQPHHERRLWRKLSRRLARALGTVRDADVFLRHLAGLRPGGDPERARALQFARNRSRLVRADGIPAVRQLAAEFLHASDALGAPSRPRPPARLPAAMTGPSPRLVLSQLSLSLDAVFADDDRVVRDADFRSAHRMRIATKLVRYGLELLEGAPLGREPALRDGLKAAAQIQGSLGHVQDHHVWKERFVRMKHEVRNWLGDTALEQHLAELAAYERSRRDALLAHFVHRWRGPGGRRSLETLRTALLA